MKPPPSLLATSTLLFATAAAAHDFWIEPSTFRPTTGQIVTVTLRVGQKLDGDPVPRVPQLIDRFVLIGDGAEVPVIGRSGAAPAGITRVGDAGAHWIGYQSYPSPSPSTRRSSIPTSATRGSKGFARCGRNGGVRRPEPRALLPLRESAARRRKPAERSAVIDKPLGFTLELVPRKNPYAITAGNDLPLTLLFRGKPLANALVVAMNRDEPEKAIRVRTDAKGRVSLPITKPGFWLIKAVHMEPAPADAGVEWESWWASITFER